MWPRKQQIRKAVHVRKLLAVITTCATLTCVPVAHAQEEPTCSAVEVIVTAGTGGSSIYEDPNNIQSFIVGTNFAKHMTAHFPQVSAWQTPYHASVGVVGTTGEPEKTEVLPYGESKRNGAKRVTDRMAEVTERCPGTKFIIAGFSQGADVTGDVAAQVAAGEAPIGVDKLLAAYLVADPGRARLTDEVGATNMGTPGRLTADGGVLIDSSAPLPAPGTVGLSGARPDGAFAALPG